MDAAAAVGAVVVLGDMDQTVLLSRMYARVCHGYQAYSNHTASLQTKREGDENVAAAAAAAAAADDGEIGVVAVDVAARTGGETTTAEEDATTHEPVTTVSSPKSGKMAATRNSVMVSAGCENIPGVEAAFRRLLSKAPSPADLVTVRQCAEKVVEMMRLGSATNAEDVDSSSVLQQAFSAVNVLEYPDPFIDQVQWAVVQSVVHDRDLVLAHSLQRPAAARKVVGVVGAGHLRGVRQLWEHVPTAESRQQYDATLLKQPTDCPR